MKKKNKQKKNIDKIPDGWELKKLGEICSVNQGLQIPISERFKEYKQGREKYITNQFLAGKSEIEYINDFTQSVVCKDTDILMTRTGNTGIVVTGVNGVFHNNFFKIKRDENLIESKYYIYFLKMPHTQYRLIHLAGSSTIPDLNHGDFFSIKINLPPLPEQKQIVGVLGVWDEVLEKLGRKIEVKKNIKKGLMQNLLTGKKRVGDFSEKWKNHSVGELLNYEQPTNYIVDSTDYEDRFETPVLTAGKTFILGYTNEENNIFPKEKLPVIIFDDFTTANKFVDFEFKVKSSAMKILKNKDKNISNIIFIFGAMQLLNFKVGEHKRNYLSEYQYLNIKLPSLEEQEVIAAILMAADEELEELLRKQKLYEEQKRFLLNNLMSGRD